MSGFATPAFLGGGPGWQEIAVILVVMLLVFGNRVPEIMRSLGKGLNQFKKGLHEAENEIKKEIDSDPGHGYDNSDPGHGYDNSDPGHGYDNSDPGHGDDSSDAGHGDGSSEDRHDG